MFSNFDIKKYLNILGIICCYISFCTFVGIVIYYLHIETKFSFLTWGERHQKTEIPIILYKCNKFPFSCYTNRKTRNIQIHALTQYSYISIAVPEISGFMSVMWGGTGSNIPMQFAMCDFNQVDCILKNTVHLVKKKQVWQ